MKHIIIDCDPGHDDAAAIMLACAHKEKLKLSGITTVCGNNTVDKVTDNARLVAAVCGEAAPVYRGSERPLIKKPVILSKYHGESGMDGPVFSETIDLPAPASLHAVESMRDILTAAREPVSIAALGPLTNIALLLRLWPALGAKIGCISLMGGGIAHGNITPFAEFNIYVDPEAADIVFSSGVPIVMSGLDLTGKAVLQPDSFAFLRSRGKAGKFFCELMDFYGKSGAEFGIAGCVLHDPCALLWLLFPELFSGTQGDVEIILSGEKQGQTVFTKNGTGSVLALQDLDVERFRAITIAAIARLDE